jgi:hypothetical protein
MNKPVGETDPSGLQLDPGWNEHAASILKNNSGSPENTEWQFTLKINKKTGATIRLSWMNAMEASIVADRIKKAIPDVEKARYVIKDNNLWAEFKKNSTAHDSGRVHDNFKFYDKHKAEYTKHFDYVWSELTSPARTIYFGGTTLTQTEPEDRAYCVWNLGIVERYIWIHKPNYFIIPKSTSPQTPATQIGDIYHEIGRWFLTLDEQDTGTMKDVYRWRRLIEKLVKVYDEHKK